MKDAGLAPAAIDYVNAHATSTQAGDSSEARALAEVFGEKKVPVSSTKSMTGHECWMAGASEIVYSMIMMQNNFIAPNINFENPDEDSARLDVVQTLREENIRLFLSNSFGFGGTNSSLIVKNWQP
jgi:3-oxoacyl-[acyl-carrier-protein] synthase-1